MLIEQVKRWQWLILSVAAGTLLWWSRRPDTGSLAGYGECLNDPAAFERALVESARGTPRFTNIRVHRQVVDDGAGSAAAVYVVSGDYCDGNPDPLDGTLHWRPRYFLAPDRHSPRMNLYDLGSAAGKAADALEQYRQIPSPTVGGLPARAAHGRSLVLHARVVADVPRGHVGRRQRPADRRRVADGD